MKNFWQVKVPWVYFVECVGHDIIKIGGTSTGVRSRVISLQQSCPFELVCIGAYAADALEEKRLHQQFAEHRTRGEWFTATGEMRRLIAEKCPDFNLVESDTIALVPEVRDRLIAYLMEKPAGIQRYERRQQLNAACKKYHVPALAVDHWMDGRRYPTLKMVYTAERFLEEVGA